MVFPKWFYHKDFPKGKIFNGPDEVPEGSVGNPADIKPTETQPIIKPTPLPNWDEKSEPEKRSPGRPRKVK